MSPCKEWITVHYRAACLYHYYVRPRLSWRKWYAVRLELIRMWQAIA